jgi:signal peptidase II
MMIRAENKMEKWGLTIIIAGALSNIIDRMMNGYVLDFIYLHYKDFYWPAFNFADIYISVGVFIIVFQLLKDMYKKVIT